MSNYNVVECSRGKNLPLLEKIHKLRYNVFKLRLNWEVMTVADVEIDNYDVYDPRHIAVVDEQNNVLACTRMLNTKGPYMLKDTFPFLLGDIQAPSENHFWEASRFAVDTDRDQIKSENGLRLATSMLLLGVAEWALEQDIQKIVAVIDMRMERILDRAGWSLKRYVSPQMVGKTLSLAGELPVSETVLADMRERAGIYESVWDHADQRVAA